MDAKAIQPFIISRVLHAPRGMVWRAWTDQDQMTWWGPKGVTIQHARMNLRPGGMFHYGMGTPDGHTMWGKWIIREVTPPERLVFVNSFSDEAGGTTRHPFSAEWPLELLSTVTFAEKEAGALLTIEWLPLNATDAECQTFDAGRESSKAAGLARSTD
jgi:uncharacterized protein YndB with AHSA1/START domain